ncbi:MAG: hypothetical protein ABFC78_01020 [Methanoregula sp.]
MRKTPDNVQWHPLEAAGGAGESGLRKTADPTEMAEELFMKVRAMV